MQTQVQHNFPPGSRRAQLEAERIAAFTPKHQIPLDRPQNEKAYDISARTPRNRTKVSNSNSKNT